VRGVAAAFGGRPGVLIGIRGMHFAGFEKLSGFMTRLLLAKPCVRTWAPVRFEPLVDWMITQHAELLEPSSNGAL
jgi:hypothetical protein